MPTEYEFLRDTAAHLIRISRASMDLGTARKLREVANSLIERADALAPKD
ncbi:MAG TPA: hypothetical protein PL193_03915 [Xanthobacteraceae bacterium]|nr:hypothetical protein [Xanthobacteraceae bacterium]